MTENNLQNIKKETTLGEGRPIVNENTFQDIENETRERVASCLERTAGRCNWDDVYFHFTWFLGGGAVFG